MSSIPSLTPNEDAVRAMIRDFSGHAEIAAPGLLGVQARLTMAMTESRVIAVAREMDRGTPYGQIMEAFVRATGDNIAAMAGSLPGAPANFADELLSAVIKATIIATGNKASQHSSVVRAVRMPTA